MDDGNVSTQEAEKLTQESRSMRQSRRECEGVCWRQEGRDLGNYDPEIMEILRKERPESLRLGTRISQ